MEEPDGHFEMAQPARLPAARVESALHGGADLHVFEMNSTSSFKAFSRRHGKFSRAAVSGDTSVVVINFNRSGPSGWRRYQSRASGAGREEKRGVNQEQTPLGFLRVVQAGDRRQVVGKITFLLKGEIRIAHGIL